MFIILIIFLAFLYFLKVLKSNYKLDRKIKSGKIDLKEKPKAP